MLQHLKNAIDHGTPARVSDQTVTLTIDGMAVSVPLISGGMHKGKAVAITALSGAPTVLGAIAGYALGTMSPLWLSLSLSFASGAMFYVVFGELLPEALNGGEPRLGGLGLGGVGVVLGHDWSFLTGV